jgi:predicted aspartyl protease
MEERLLVDSGALYTVLPEEDLRRLGIVPHSDEEFELADGATIRRKVGDAFFEYRGRKGAGPVVFGEKDDSKLLGTLTLEALGFALDPLKRRLHLIRKKLA